MNTQSDNINELLAALAKAQGMMSAAAKDCKNPFFKSSYSDLNSIWNACREPLSSNGLAVIQTVQQRESGDVLFTVLGHSSGQWISSTMSIRMKSDGKTNELQVMGSCLSYLRRYSLAAIVGVSSAEEDDDGNSGGNSYQARPSPTPQQAPAPIAPKLITADQAAELGKILEKCSPDLKANIQKLIDERGLKGIHSFGEALYKTVLGRALEDMKYYQASLAMKDEPSITE